MDPNSVYAPTIFPQTEQPRTGLVRETPGVSAVPTPAQSPGDSPMFRQRLDTGEEFFSPDMPTGFPDYPAPAPQTPEPHFTAPTQVQGEATPQGGQVPTVGVPDEQQQQAQLAQDQLLKMDAQDKLDRLDNMSAAENYGHALVDRITDLVSGPGMAAGRVSTDVINNVLAATGLEMLTGKITNLDASTMHKYFNDKLREIGIETEHDPNTVSGKFGKETVDSAIMLAGMLRAAPHMAAVGGSGLANRIVARVGESISKHPWVAALTEPGSTFGGAYGEVNWGEGGAIPGALIGGVAGDAARRLTLLPFKLAKKLMDAASQRMANNAMPSTAPYVPGRPTTPLRDQAISAEEATSRVQVFSENQINGELQRVQIELAKAVDDVSRGNMGVVRRGQNRGQPIQGTGPEMQERLAQKLDEVEKIAENIEDRFWKRVPQKAKIPVSDLMSRVYGMVSDIQNKKALSSFPKSQVEELLNALAPQRGPDGRMAKNELTVEKLRAIRRSIFDARKTEQMALRRGQTPNGPLISNMIDLEKWIDDAIADGLPDKANIALQQARNFSIKKHDMFTRGPVGDLLARSNRDDFNFSPERFLQDLMKRYQGVDSAVNIGRSLQREKNPAPGSFHSRGLAYPTAATPDEISELKQFETMMEDTIRTMFRDAADGMPPEQASKWIARHENAIRPLAKVHAELLETFTNLTRLTEERNLITESALNRAMGQDGRIAITKLFTDKNPAALAKKLLHGEATHYDINGVPQSYTTEGIAKDAHALEGLRNGVIDEFFTRSKMDPLRAEQMIKDPATKRMLETVLDKDSMARMTKMIDIAARLERGDIGTKWQKYGPGAVMLARVFGSHGAGVVSRILGNQGGSSIQTASIFSTTAKTTVIKALKGLEPRTILARAIQDPSWERILYSKEPSTPKDVAQLTKIARRTVTTMEGLRQYLND